jgi:hypothetical protein
MRILAASIVIGPLMLIGALPAVAGPSTLAFGSDAPVRLAADVAPTTDRDTYTQKARNDMHEWLQKLHAFNEKMKANGHKAGNAAENDLDKAWTDYRTASHKLRTVGDDGWESAKTSYDKASRDLANAWEKFRSKDM